MLWFYESISLGKKQTLSKQLLNLWLSSFLLLNTKKTSNLQTSSPLLPSPPAPRGFIYSLFWSGPRDESLHSSLSDTHNLWLLPCQSLVLDQPTHQRSPPALTSLSSLKKACLQGREQSQYTEWQRGVGGGVRGRDRQTGWGGRGRPNPIMPVANTIPALPHDWVLWAKNC